MVTTRTFILAIASLFMGSALFGQPYYFRHLQVENGLSNNAVICSLQDKKGFLWFGTKDGLDRFDGYSFKIFRNDPDDSSSIGSNFIHCLYEDQKGLLWVGTEKGLYRFDAATESFRVVDGAADGPIRDVVMDGSGDLWFISGFTLMELPVGRQRLDYFDIGRYFEATSLCISADGTLWVSSAAGLLYRWNQGTHAFTGFDLFDHSDQTQDRWLERVYATAGGTLLVGTATQGAKLFDVRTSAYKDILTYNEDRTAVFARNFIQTSDDECWIGTESGVYIYNSRTGQVLNLRKKYNDPYSLSDNAVYTFCKDKEGGIWAGTYFGGVNYYPRQYNAFRKYFPKSGENSLDGYVVREIHQDSYGNLWIGTEDAGLNRLDTATGLFTHFLPTGARGSISYSNIHGLLVHSNCLWIGTFEHGLDIMDIPSGKVIRHYSTGNGEHDLRSSFIYCIYQDPSGGILLGTTRGAYAYDSSKDYFTPLPGMPLYNWYSCLLRDKKGGFWAGTYGNGVHYYNALTGKSRDFRYKMGDRRSLGSDRVNSIFEDSSGSLWFATEGGLCRYDAATEDFTRFTTREGFPTNFILSILEDEKAVLWISTSKGLVCFNPRTQRLTNYTKDNGLLNDQFNFSSAYRDAGGRMYFGSVKGMISFRPWDFIPNSFVPPVYFTGFQVDNKELPIARKGSPLRQSLPFSDNIVLDHNQSTFSIDFAALGYTAPEMTEYAYKMDGLDKGWTHLKTNRKVYFTGLASGHYVFRVKASNSSGVWNEQEAKLSIEVLPPWWASLWACAFYIFFGGVCIWYAIRIYHRNVEEKNRRKIEHLERIKEKEIFNAKIEFFTNVAHEIRTPLTLIRGPLEKVIKKAGAVTEIKDSLRIMEKNTLRLIDLTNQLLDFRQTEIGGFSLNFVKANIPELLEDNYISFKPLAEQKNLRFELSLPVARLCAYVDTDAFNKILANLFSNAVKYAEGKVIIFLRPFDEGDTYFTIEISNDGYQIPYEMREKIFEPFFRLKETEKQKGTGIGLALSRSLAQLHKGVLVLKVPEDGLNTFSLTIPIHQENEFNLTL
ncbi:ligand-binding sensor domain-containing protein [Puia dinghuensis]|uniref:histidine kinase n=1 Tax=Puia dinghuensis TaxID=1792502 RepID=A0A8J2UD69_9BACT|nr:sensor histidine kinase [Puia dinghuensis]GGA99357.1 hybrid sensor histidine kinase/response regulator [Puia dinghuensis]